MIELINVSKKFKEKVIFDDVSVAFDSKITKIKGENGIGKSILLKLIVGYSVQDTGKIVIDDIELRSRRDFIEHAGVSINAPEFIPNWSGFENLKYLMEVTRICNINELNELINIFGLENDINKKYKTYSLGMRQKLRLIQALMDKPKYLILDEPFDALDERSKHIVKDHILEYLASDHSRQLIYTSHSEADDCFADVIFKIEDCKIHIL